MKTTKKAIHIMLDLETLGIQSSALVTQIGAALFLMEEDTIIDTFNESLDFSTLDSMNVDPDTLKFWVRNTHNAKLFKNLLNNKDGLSDELLWKSFFDWVSNIVSNFPDYDVKIWGNGITFDVGKVYYNFERFGLKMPIAYFNEMDLRTQMFYAANIIGCSDWDIKSIIKNESSHDALSDVLWEIEAARLADKILLRKITNEEVINLIEKGSGKDDNKESKEDSLSE